jgi:tetratricopeptide (TPR) repeat protein
MFLQELARGIEPHHAFALSFGGLEGDRLRAELRTYLTVGRLKLTRVAASGWQGTVETRSLAASDVHGLRAMLLLVGAAALGSHSAALDSDAEANASLERDPGNADAAAVSLYWRYGASAPRLDRESAAREIIRGHPDDWRGWAMLADALQGTDEAGAARARAAELAPGNPAALEALARDQLARGKARDAVLVARKAVTLAPTDPDVLETYAAALAGTGDCAAATGLQHRVVEMMRERGGGRADSSEQTLRMYEGGCLPSRGKKSSR